MDEVVAIPKHFEQLRGTFNQSLRIVEFDIGSSVPIVFSARMCNFDPTQTGVITPLLAIGAPHTRDDSPRITGQKYFTHVPGAIASEKVTLNFIEQYNGKMTISFEYGFLPRRGHIPVEIDGGIISIDSTDPHYVQLLYDFSFMKWSNHLLIYDYLNDTVKWNVGWNTFELSNSDFNRASSDRVVDHMNTKANPDTNADDSPTIAGSICRAPVGKYCATHKKFSHLSIELPLTCVHSGSAFLDVKLPYSFPWSWSWSRFSLPYVFTGMNFRVDIQNEGIRTLTKILTGKHVSPFVHFVHDFSRRALELTLPGTETIVFRNC